MRFCETQAAVMSVRQNSIVAVGFVILTECLAFGGGKDQVAAQVAQRAEGHRGRELAYAIGSPSATQERLNARRGGQQDKEGKSQIGRSALAAPTIARESGAV